MGDPWTEFYRSVGIGVPEAPVAQQPMSVEDIYRGIYPASSPGLVSRPVSTVPINPTTGMPYSPRTVQTATGPGSRGRPSWMSIPTLPNQPNGTIVANKDTARLPMSPVGYGPDFGTSATAAIENAAPRFKPFASPYSAPARFAAKDAGYPLQPTHKLNTQPSNEEGQYYADSMGMIIQTPNGTIYTPKGGSRTPQQTVQARSAARAAPTQRQGGFGGLFGSLFGGGQGGGLFGGGTPQAQAPRNAAGRPIAVSGPVIGNAVHGTTASGSTGDYGSSPGQITAGLKPGERTYDPDTNSWGLKR